MPQVTGSATTVSRDHIQMSAFKKRCARNENDENQMKALKLRSTIIHGNVKRRVQILAKTILLQQLPGAGEAQTQGSNIRHEVFTSRKETQGQKNDEEKADEESVK